MTNDIVLKMFMDSPKAQELAEFFKAIYNLTDNDFIKLDLEVDTSVYVITNKYLKETHSEYKGRLTDSSMQVGAFVSSLYQLPKLEPDNPTEEWLFISKLCHFLLYSYIHQLPNRVKDICFMGRAWFKPNSGHEDLIKRVLELQNNNLQTMFIDFRDEVEKLQRTHNDMYKDLIKAYRIIDYAYNKRHQITRKNTRKKSKKIKIDKPYKSEISFPNLDDSKDVLVSHTHYDTTENDIDITRERLDDNIPDFVLLNQSTIEKTEKYTPALVYRRTKSKLQHANKNERYITINTRTIPLFAVQDVFARTWQLFNQENIARTNKSAYAYILLSMLTGYPISMLMSDLNNNNKQIIIIDRPDQSYELLLKLNITPLRLKTSGIKDVIANKSVTMRIPLPNELGVFFTYKTPVADKKIVETISLIQNQLGLPYLSKARIENALYTLMLHHTNSGQIGSIITSKNEKNRADLWYSSHTETEIINCYHRAIALLTLNTLNFKTDYITQESHSDTNTAMSIGSQNSPDYPLVKVFFKHLHDKVITTKDITEQFNAYSIWMWHICLLLTSIRAVEAAPGYLNQFNLETGLGWISDKEERATATSQRYVPLCDFLVDEIKSYLQYLETHKQKYKWLSKESNHAEFVDDVLSSHRPLLNILTKKGTFEVMRPALARQFINKHFKFKEDWTRHVGQRYLHAQQVPESLVLSAFGHEGMGQESWRKHSSLSIGDLLTLKEVYQQMVVDLDLQAVRLSQ